MVAGSFVTFVRDQLGTLGSIDARPMFGGFGLYLDNVFFGIVHDDRLYFKTDSRSVADYIAQGMAPFRPNPRQTLKNYYEVPADVLEDAGELALWADTALKVAHTGARKTSRS